MKHAGTRPDTPWLWRAAWVGVPTLMVAVLVTVATVAQVLGNSAPAVAVAWGPWNAEAKGKLAFRLVEQQGAAGLAKAATIAADALRRSPGNVNALAAYGTAAAAAGDIRRADRVFAYAERLSRHNRSVELYLIERSVARGNIPETLAHYDHALSTSRSIQAILFPVLIPAAGDPAVLAALTERLKRRPVWWLDFVRVFVGQGPDPARTLPVLLSALPLRPDYEMQRAVLSGALSRLIAAQNYSAAARIYSHATGRQRSSQAVWNGAFENPNLLPPIDWQIHDEPGLTGIVQSREGGGNALFISADGDHDGEIARQLLLLSPGNHSLTALVGDTDGTAPPRLVLACVGRENTPVGSVAFPAAATEGRKLEATLQIPANCPAQWLIVRTSPSDVRSDNPAWIDNIAVSPTVGG